MVAGCGHGSQLTRSGFSDRGSAVEMMELNVIRDCFRKQIGARVAGMEALPQIGRRDIFMHGLKQVDAGPLVRVEVEGSEVIERRAGAAGDDPLSEFKQAAGLAPAWEVEKTVRTDKVEEHRIRHRSLQFSECIHGV